MFPNKLICLKLVVMTLATIHGSSIMRNTTQDNSNHQPQKFEGILKYLNNSVDPCDDFYEFSCGNYGKYIAVDILESYGTWNVLNNISWTLKSKVMKEIRSSVDVNDTEADKKMKRFYAACMNTSTTEGVHNNRLKELLSEFGKFPPFEGDQWQEDDFDWVQLIADIKHRTDVGIILNANIAPDFTNNTFNRVTIVQPKFQYSKRAYYTDKVFEKYQSYLMMDIYMLLVSSVGMEEELARRTAREIFQLEADLAQAMQDVELTPPSDFYALINIDEMQEKYISAWDSKKLLKAALGIEPSLVMVQPKYLQNVFEVIQKTPKTVVANYIFYTYLSVYFRSLPWSNMTIDSHCEELTNEYFEEVLQNLVYRKYFNGQEEKIIDILWRELKDAFEEILKSPSLNWINNDKTRQNAVEKLRAMKLKIDNYEEIDFDQKFAELNINSHDLLGNIQAVLKIRANQERLKMSQPPQFKIPPNFSPSYTIEENTIHIPILILQADNPWPLSYANAISFGNLGFYIAHEMLHGFDDIGCNYDGSGNSLDWWDSTSIHEHQEGAKCFEKQYRSYTYDGSPLPDIESQTENIADNGGLHLAYEAYQKWRQVKASGKSYDLESLLGLNFTNNQLFFISYSQAFCSGRQSNYTQNTSIDSTDIHVPGKLRVIGTLSNFEEFAKAFNCPKGSAMNPVEKCIMY